MSLTLWKASETEPGRDGVALKHSLTYLLKQILFPYIEQDKDVCVLLLSLKYQKSKSSSQNFEIKLISTYKSMISVN